MITYKKSILRLLLLSICDFFVAIDSVVLLLLQLINQYLAYVKTEKYK